MGKEMLYEDWLEVSISFYCIDCQVNTLANGHYYVLKHSVWALTGLTLGDNKMLCLPCCEARIGRDIEMSDLLDGNECNDDYEVWEYING